MKLDKNKYDAGGRLKNGIVEEFFKGGALSCVGDGNGFGNEQLMQTGSFIDEKKAGVWKRYHPNGALYDEGKFLDDKRIGEWHTFNADGKLAKTTRHNRTR